MIHHGLKCIFIHIPRTGGTSIEDFFGKHVWPMGGKKACQHITARHAKKIYAEWWDDYFKFSMIRNPYDLAVSQSRFPGHYKIKACNIDTEKDITLKLTGRKIAYETSFIDNRTGVKHTRKPADETGWPIEYTRGAYLSNILNEEIDFIGRYENYIDDVCHVLEQINYTNQRRPNPRAWLEQKPHRMGTNWRKDTDDRKDPKSYRKYYTPEFKDYITSVYQKDLERFNYEW